MMKKRLHEIELRRSVLFSCAESQRRSLVNYCQTFSPGIFVFHYAESAVKTILKSKITKVLTIFSSLWAIVHRRK